jgi:DNA-binding response OmpR family regulator
MKKPDCTSVSAICRQFHPRVCFQRNTVTRKELQARLWPADTFVSFDEGLNTALRKLRVLFGDTADNPRFIETIRGAGIVSLHP